MIKGIKKGSSKESLRYDDTLIVPIIENTPFEKDLTSSLKQAIEGNYLYISLSSSYTHTLDCLFYYYLIRIILGIN